jgi:hypothetical protein
VIDEPLASNGLSRPLVTGTYVNSVATKALPDTCLVNRVSEPLRINGRLLTSLLLLFIGGRYYFRRLTSPQVEHEVPLMERHLQVMDHVVKTT